jgi:predicted NAD-dependent protein-ADP-ribosyltransferase YbiA (DUF1768 family)
MAGIIRRFIGEFGYLSNFYPASVTLGLEYPTAEHAFQASKSQDFFDHLAIQQAPKPRDAKRLGRTVELRPDWEGYSLHLASSA